MGLNLTEAFNRAMSYEEYIDSLGDYLSLHRLHYKKLTIDSVFTSKIQEYQSTRILVITEAWCGDSLAILPIIKKVAEINQHWEIKILRRDASSDLMNHFLTNGTKAIPVFLFLDDRGEMLFKWGPRPKAAAEIFENHRESINQGQIEKQDVIKKIRTYYAKDKGKSSLTELIDIFNRHLN